jgi:DDE family transposase
MPAKKSQRLRASRRVAIQWSEKLVDPRSARGRRHKHLGLLALMAVAFACGRTVLRQMEDLSADLSRMARRVLELPRKVSDTALYLLLGRQRPDGLRETVWAMVKELFEKKVFGHDLFPHGVMSFDGKSTWTSTRRWIEGAKESVCPKNGKPMFSFASMRACLTSCGARPCVDLELIPEKTGESPAFRSVFRRMVEHFSRLFLIVTADAGMTCRENAALVTDAAKHYLFALKGNQEHLFGLAQEWLLPGATRPRAYTTEWRGGVRVDRELYSLTVKDAPEMDFPGVQQLWCVRQVAFSRAGLPETTEVRYFLSSIPPNLLSHHEQLGLVRLHWGIENGLHWTLDSMLGEDDRQPCQASKDAIEVVAWLRVIGFNLLAAWRSRAPRKDQQPLPWRRAMEQLRDALVAILLPDAATAVLA